VTDVTLTLAEAEELTLRIWEAIERQPPEWQERMREAIRSGVKPVAVAAPEDGAKLLVNFGGIPLLEVRRSDLTAATRHDTN